MSCKRIYKKLVKFFVDAYAIDQVQIAWGEIEPITRNPNIAMSDMHIVDLKPGLCDGNYSTGIINFLLELQFFQEFGVV